MRHRICLPGARPAEDDVLETLNARLVRILLAAAALLIFLLSFLVVADVIGRAVFNSPVKGTPEIVSMSIVVICFLLAGYAVQSGGMIHADILVSAFGPRGRSFAQLIAHLRAARHPVLRFDRVGQHGADAARLVDRRIRG
jgi:TRAP-type C4-dicarboxylate transport system permease small subunit